MMDEEFDDPDFLRAVAASETANGAGGSGTVRSKVIQPKPQALPGRQGPSAILVSTRQKGNPILNHVKSLPWEYSDIPCDYVLGATTCALFLSLKYHRLHPEYIYGRLRQLGKLYNLRVLLTMVDITNHEEALKELSKTSVINNLTLVLCWSAQEAGRYLELFKSYEHASPASIRAHQAETYKESLTEFVTTPRNINKTDAASLISNFGSLRAAVNAQPEEVAMVPGWGEKKVKAWCSTVREPFRVKRAGKTSIALLRQETTVTDSEMDEASTPDQRNTPGPMISTIPISSVPSRARQSSTPAALSRGNTHPEQGVKRSKLHEVAFGDFSDDDDEEEEEEEEEEEQDEDTVPVLSKDNYQDIIKPGVQPTPATKRPEPQLSEGVMAALTKLRQNG